MGYTCLTGFGSNLSMAWPMFTMQNTMQMLINDRSMCMVAILGIYQIIRHCTITKSTSLFSLHATHRERKNSPPFYQPSQCAQSHPHPPNHNPKTPPRALPRGVRPPLPSPTHPRTVLTTHAPSHSHTYIFTPPLPLQRNDPIRFGPLPATCCLLA